MMTPKKKKVRKASLKTSNPYSDEPEEMPKKACIFVKETALPGNFADKVLDLEIKIDSGVFTLADIDSLVYLYSLAIEHYEKSDPAKSSNFYQRTQRLLAKPAVFNKMKNNGSLRKAIGQKKEKLGEGDNNYDDGASNRAARGKSMTASSSFYTPSRKKLEMDVLLMQNEDKNDKIIKKHQKQLNLKSELVESDIMTQKRNLELRLLKRKIRKGTMTRKSVNFPLIGFRESFNDEFSSILDKQKVEKDESWAEENNSLLKEIDSTKDKTEEEPIFESFEC